MKELDRKVFGSWQTLIFLSLILGFLFAVAMALIELMFEGVLKFTQDNVTVGLSISAIFLLISAWVRRSIQNSA